jgi:hypothetical protein
LLHAWRALCAQRSVDKVHAMSLANRAYATVADVRSLLSASPSSA